MKTAQSPAQSPENALLAGRTRLRVGIVQSAVGESKRDNVEAAAAEIEKLAREGAELVCLQELFATRYFCQVEDEQAFALAEPVDGPTISAMKKVAAQWRVTIVVPFFERRAPGVYHNSAVVLGRHGEVCGLYRKMHLPDDPGFSEKYYFAPGDLGFLTIPTDCGPIAPLICWDQWFPEAARLAALGGATLLVYPTAIGWLADEKASLGEAQLDAWRTIQRAHAIANGVFVVAVNRVGREQQGSAEIEFWDHSFVCDPFGRVLSEAGVEPTSFVCDLNLSEIETTRRAWPFFRDRRVDVYEALSRRWGQ